MENTTNHNNDDHNEGNGDQSPQDAPLGGTVHTEEDPLLVEARQLMDGEFSEPEFDEPAFTEPPPPAHDHPMVEDRLVRDPHASFGGVLSGIAHRFGWDVSLTRLAFVVLLFVSGFLLVPVYLLAWVIIPRANYWPPAVRTHDRSLSGRDLGIALVGAAVLIALAAGSGRAAGIVVPLALVAGGVWLLLQSPRSEVAPAGAEGAVGFAPTDFARAGEPTQASSWSNTSIPPASSVPVASRSRGRKVGIIALILIGLSVPVIAIAGAVGFATRSVSINDTTVFGPVEIADIPLVINEDTGEHILDLTAVDFSSIEAGDEPVEVMVDVDLGRIEVIVGPDVRVDAVAEVNGLGSVTVFGDESDGFEPRLTTTADDAQLDLDLRVDLGDIEVTRTQ